MQRLMSHSCARQRPTQFPSHACASARDISSWHQCNRHAPGTHSSVIPVKAGPTATLGASCNGLDCTAWPPLAPARQALGCGGGCAAAVDGRRPALQILQQRIQPFVVLQSVHQPYLVQLPVPRKPRLIINQPNTSNDCQSSHSAMRCAKAPFEERLSQSRCCACHRWSSACPQLHPRLGAIEKGTLFPIT
jgi:hypothetical protein